MPLRGGPASARPIYYDRTPLTRILHYSGDLIAPHAATTRYTYTVPSTKKAFLENSNLAYYRDGAAATPGKVTLLVRYTDSVPTTGNVEQLFYFGGTVGQNAALPSAPVMAMNAGDVAFSTTSDLSADGTMQLRSSTKYTEYDA